MSGVSIGPPIGSGAGVWLVPGARTKAWLASQPLLLALAGFVILWTAYEIIAHGAGDVHNDMAEAYAWGQELQAGYYKHPPFWAWVTFAWFQIFPVEDWSAYLFSALNSAFGIYCVSRCAAFFIAGRRAQQIAALLLMLIPAYTFLAMKMNANTILLSVWPAAAWAFLAVMQRSRALAALLLGLLASCALLSKYNSAIFLLCILIASFLHPAARRFWLSRMPLLVVAGGLPLTALHGWWLWQNDFLPFHYLSGLRIHGAAGSALHGINFLFAEALYASPAIVALAVLGLWTGMQRERFAQTRMNRVLLCLALGPPLLTALAGAALGTRTPALWGLQNLFLVPVLAMQFFSFADIETLQRRVRTAIFVILLGAVAASPVVAWVKFHYGDRSAVDPRSELTRQLTKWWHAEFGMPLRLVGGDENYALAATFYSPDHPSYYISGDRRLTPWITDARLRQSGALLICNEIDEVCEDEARRVSADVGDEKTISVVKEFLGKIGQNRKFSFYVIPPVRNKTDEIKHW